MKNIIHKIKANSFSLLVLVLTPFTIIYNNYQIVFLNLTKLKTSYLAIQCVFTVGGIFLTLLIFKYFKNENTVRWLFICFAILNGSTLLLLAIVNFKIYGTVKNEDLFSLPLTCFLVAYPSSEFISRFIDRFNLNKPSEN